MEGRQIELDALLRLLKGAVGELLRLRDADAFLSWMQTEAPERFPEVFAGLDDRVVRALTLELGRQVWNAMPWPDNDVQPRILAQPRTRPIPGEPCPCGSGRSYADCCASAPAVTGLGPELIRRLMDEENVEDVEDVEIAGE
jgi:hypothetical protein